MRRGRNISVDDCLNQIISVQDQRRQQYLANSDDGHDSDQGSNKIIDQSERPWQYRYKKYRDHVNLRTGDRHNMANMERDVGTTVLKSSKSTYRKSASEVSTKLFGYRTVAEGEQALKWNYAGEGKLITGPARVTLWRSRLEKLDRFIAGQGEYLLIQLKEGTRIVRPGPCSMFLNPIEHDFIEQRKAIFINSGECMVIYRVKGDANKDNNGPSTTKPISGGGDAVSLTTSNDVERALKYGPCQYIPQPEEWIHEFMWHGSDPGDKTHKTYGSLTFTKLRTIADQTYYNVREVRTKDDTLLTVKLMIFFQLSDINKMLDNTHDPIGDFINAACSDVVAFCATLTYEEFLEKTSKLNELSAFKQLCARAETIGYEIKKVVFRGFHSSDALQSMHDKSIQERTRLRLETDTEHQRQQHLDFQLEKEEQRSGRERALQSQADEHRRMLAAANHAEELRQKREGHEHELACQRQWQQVTDEKLARLKEFGVNLTELLVAREKVPDKVYRIEDGNSSNNKGESAAMSSSSEAGKVRLHLHESVMQGV